MEEKLRKKFSNCFHSVRKAFLALDSDHDGYIVAEDILKFFGNDGDMNYQDIHKIIADKASTVKNKLGFSDFAKWLGCSIH